MKQTTQTSPKAWRHALTCPFSQLSGLRQNQGCGGTPGGRGDACAPAVSKHSCPKAHYARPGPWERGPGSSQGSGEVPCRAPSRAKHRRAGRRCGRRDPTCGLRRGPRAGLLSSFLGRGLRGRLWNIHVSPSEGPRPPHPPWGAKGIGWGIGSAPRDPPPGVQMAAPG